MAEYPSNSDRHNEAPQSVQNYREKRVSGPVIDGGASFKQKTAWDSFSEFFGIAECHTFRDYVGALSDMTNRVYGAIDTLLGGRRYQNPGVPGGRVAYGNYYNVPVSTANQNTQQNMPVIGPDGTVLFDDRPKAELVLFKMHEVLSVYNNVSRGDMYDLAGVTSPKGYNDEKYGWLSLQGVNVIPFGHKYIINLPPAVPLR